MTKPTFGTSLKLGTDPQALTALQKVVTITPPKRSREAVDATHHGSPGGAMEFIPDGVYDPGGLSGSLNYVAGDADDDALNEALMSDEIYTFEFTANGEAGKEVFTCKGTMTEYGPDELPVTGKQTASFSIKLSGQTTQAAAA